MPTILRIASYRFFFYSNEGKEPAHIHIEISGCECKFWLEPIKLAVNYGVKPNQLREIEKLIFTNKEFIIGKYNEYHQNR